MSLDEYLTRGSGTGTGTGKPEGSSGKPSIRSPYTVPSSTLAQWKERGTDPYPKPGAKPPPPPPSIVEVFIDTAKKAISDSAKADAEAAAQVLTESLSNYAAYGLPDDLRIPNRTGPVISEQVRTAAGNAARTAGGLLRDAVVFVFGQMTGSSRQSPHQEPSNDGQPQGAYEPAEPVQPLLPDPNVVEGEFTVIG